MCTYLHENLHGQSKRLNNENGKESIFKKPGCHGNVEVNLCI